MRPAALFLSGIAGAALILAAACGGAAEPTEPVATTPPAATTAPAETTPPEGTTAPAETAPPDGTTPPAGNGGDLVAQGQMLVQEQGCLACHSTDGTTLVGPTWQGVYGSEETLTDGTTVTVDDEYIRESIVDPNAKIVEGFQPNLMPTNFGETLSEEQINAIIAYIESLQ